MFAEDSPGRFGPNGSNGWTTTYKGTELGEAFSDEGHFSNSNRGQLSENEGVHAAAVPSFDSGKSCQSLTAFGQTVQFQAIGTYIGHSLNRPPGNLVRRSVYKKFTSTTEIRWSASRRWECFLFRCLFRPVLCMCDLIQALGGLREHHSADCCVPRAMPHPFPGRRRGERLLLRWASLLKSKPCSKESLSEHFDLIFGTSTDRNSIFRPDSPVFAPLPGSQHHHGRKQRSPANSCPTAGSDRSPDGTPGWSKNPQQPPNQQCAPTGHSCGSRIPATSERGGVPATVGWEIRAGCNGCYVEGCPGKQTGTQQGNDLNKGFHQAILVLTRSEG
jgi:hypothetical protein